MWTWYAGDRGKAYLYLFDAWMKGVPWNPSLKPSSRFAFILSLASLFAAFWWIRRPIFGALIVVFLGSNPFQIYEVYGRDNVFGWSISAAILLLALHVPLLRRWKPDERWAFAWPILVGLFIATLRTVRSEPATLLASAGITYAFVTGFSWRRRAALVFALVVSFGIGQAYWGRHFVQQHERAAKAIAAVGGHPFPGKIRLYHHFWHPVWCGLGDYDRKYGYVWKDGLAAAYATPFLEAKGIYVPQGTFFENGDPREYIDPETKIYKKLPYDIPFYNEVIRDKVLGDIKKDPLWYAEILAKRAGRILVEVTPIRATWWGGWLTIPWSGVPAVAVILLFFTMRSKLLAGTALFTLPTVASAFIVYSGGGMTFYGVYHIIAFGLLVGVLVHQALYWAPHLLRRYPWGRKLLRLRAVNG
jgi:hypothetical protein